LQGVRTSPSSPRRQREAQNEIAAPPSAITTAGGDGYEMLAIDGIHRWRREHARSGVELPELLAGLRIERKEVAGDVAAGAREDDAARCHDRTGLAEAFEDLAPLQLAGRRIVGGEVSLRSASRVERLIDGADVKAARP